MTIENHGKLTIWRCISYSKWWFSMAMLVFRGVVKLKRNKSKRNTNQSSTALMSWHFSLVHWFLQSPKVTLFLFPSQRFCWAHVILMLRHGASPREIWEFSKKIAVGNATSPRWSDRPRRTKIEQTKKKRPYFLLYWLFNNDPFNGNNPHLIA